MMAFSHAMRKNASPNVPIVEIEEIFYQLLRLTFDGKAKILSDPGVLSDVV